MLPPSTEGPDGSTQAALQAVFAGTASEVGDGFFRALVENLARALGTHGAWVTEFFRPGARPARARLQAGE